MTFVHHVGLSTRLTILVFNQLVSGNSLCAVLCVSRLLLLCFVFTSMLLHLCHAHASLLHAGTVGSICVYGGGNRREQVKACREGVEIVVATPGRLNDLIDSDILNMRTVTYLVCNEQHCIYAL